MILATTFSSNARKPNFFYFRSYLSFEMWSLMSRSISYILVVVFYSSCAIFYRLATINSLHSVIYSSMSFRIDYISSSCMVCYYRAWYSMFWRSLSSLASILFNCRALYYLLLVILRWISAVCFSIYSLVIVMRALWINDEYTFFYSALWILACAMSIMLCISISRFAPGLERNLL